MILLEGALVVHRARVRRLPGGGADGGGGHC
jgi:hypothetical protein